MHVCTPVAVKSVGITAYPKGSIAAAHELKKRRLAEETRNRDRYSKCNNFTIGPNYFKGLRFDGLDQIAFKGLRFDVLMTRKHI